MRCAVPLVVTLAFAAAAITCGGGNRGRTAAGGSDAGAPLPLSAASSVGDSGSPGDAADGGPILRGTVVGFFDGRPLAGRTVTVAGRSTTTDARGAFRLPDARPGAYDVIVSDPGGGKISVYTGVDRRDPVLPHASAPPIAHAGSVTGAVSGGGNYPLGGDDLVTVYFFSNQADRSWSLGAGQASLFSGPEYGPMQLSWDGATSIAGMLLAFGTFQGGDGGTSSWFASQTVALADGDARTVNLALAPVTVFGRVAASLVVPAAATSTSVAVSYRLQVLHARFLVPVAEPASMFFEASVADLTPSGAEPCVSATTQQGAAVSVTERCGVTLGAADLTLTVQDAPSLALGAGAALYPNSPIGWTPFAGGVHLLQLRGTGDATAPDVDVFTAGVRTTWPDLTDLGAPFPAGATYECAVLGLGPYSSIDEALGPEGIGAPFPTEIRRGASASVQVTLR